MRNFGDEEKYYEDDEKGGKYYKDDEEGETCLKATMLMVMSDRKKTMVTTMKIAVTLILVLPSITASG